MGYPTSYMSFGDFDPRCKGDSEDGESLIRRIRDELVFARKKFPGRRHLTVALLEEAGELAKAQLQRKRREEIEKEAIQVIAMAIRILSEGDADLEDVTDAEALP